MSSHRSSIAAVRANGRRAPLGARLLAPLCLALVGLLAGCGSSDNGVASKSPTEILAAARSAALSASSVHIKSNSNVGRAKLTLEATLGKQQGQAKVSLLGIGFEAVRVGNTMYVKGNPVFNARLESVLGVKIPPNTWLKGPVAGTLGQVGSFTNPSKELPVILGSRGTLSKGAKVKVNGQSTIQLKEVAKLYTGTLYVATTGQPYPIQMLKHGRENGQITFSGWNNSVSVSAPANAVEVSQLQHKTH
jgi:hypothetical protein